ncbi:MAG: hypothetical protein ACOY4Q_05400 [Bacillota bacterium]
MKFLIYAAATLVTTGVAAYTFNFGRWAWQKKNYRGAAGIFILALITLTVPLGLLFLRT